MMDPSVSGTFFLTASDTTYHIYHAGGQIDVSVNQQQAGGQWNLLGTYNFAAGSTDQIRLDDIGNGIVIADAVMLVDANAPSATNTCVAQASMSVLTDHNVATLTGLHCFEKNKVRVWWRLDRVIM